MRLLALVCLIITLQLGGCVVTNGGREPSTASSSDALLDLIARDFVGVLSQLQSVLPADTTVDMQSLDERDAFTLAMLGALQRAGYGVRWVDDEGSESLFQYRQVAENAAAEVHRVTYELAVGFVEMRRGYAYDARQRIRPVTALYLRGANASGVVLDDTIFDQSLHHAVNEMNGQNHQPGKSSVEARQTAQENAAPLKSLAKNQSTASAMQGLQNATTLKVPTDANPLNLIVGEAVAGKPLSLPLVAMPREVNVFALGESNFSSFLSGREVIAEQILIFDNDSMRLGARNKRLVDQMVERFDPLLDVFSVIGCSMGPTRVNGGNAALALGRAGRVVEALRFAGVEDSRILDEGCWAGDGQLENLPRRGVVLTLNRQT